MDDFDDFDESPDDSETEYRFDDVVVRSTKHITEESDQAAIWLARGYAVEIDEGGDLQKLGPLLLSALDSLLLTPRARASVRKGLKDATRPASPLDAIRDEVAERRERKAKASNLDSASGGSE